MFTTLISVSELQALQAAKAPLMVFDCTGDLMKPELGAQQYEQQRIAGAVYADLNTALSAKNDPSAASGGRHPLPSQVTFAAWLGSVGFEPGMQAVVYDRNGCNYCARLWWMLKWLGHEAVAVLDGGLQAWVAGGAAVENGPSNPILKQKPPYASVNRPPIATQLVAAPDIMQNLGRPGQTLIDARATPRFKGEVEPLDPVAGHIPGALNRPFSLNLGADGKFKGAAVLRAEFDALLAGKDPAGVVHQCGSGVSALPNLLAMEIAGLGRSALYAGSWSDWCSDASRPMARG